MDIGCELGNNYNLVSRATAQGFHKVEISMFPPQDFFCETGVY
jgi:hypothetical protein